MSTKENSRNENSRDFSRNIFHTMSTEKNSRNENSQITRIHRRNHNPPSTVDRKTSWPPRSALAKTHIAALSHQQNKPRATVARQLVTLSACGAARAARVCLLRWHAVWCRPHVLEAPPRGPTRRPASPPPPCPSASKWRSWCSSPRRRRTTVSGGRPPHRPAAWALGPAPRAPGPRALSRLFTPPTCSVDGRGCQGLLTFRDGLLF